MDDNSHLSEVVPVQILGSLTQQTQSMMEKKKKKIENIYESTHLIVPKDVLGIV